MNYIQISISPIDQEQSELLMARLMDSGLQGFEEEENNLNAFFEEDKFNEENISDIVSTFSLSFSKKIIAEKNWNEEWEKNLIEAALERVKKSVSARQYQIYYLNVIKKMAVEQVCHTLGVNAAQVYLAKHRVGSLLKKEIRALETKLM